jgi:hypothetical protein
MPNHVHLLIEAGETPLSKIMQAIQFSYTQSFNRRHRKVGHLFQGRYKAVLCQKDEYLLQLIRYIHLNPVRAKIVKDPKDYLWSSHRALLGMDRNPRCDVNAVLREFGRRRNIAIRQYRAFVLDAIGLGHQNDYYDWKDQRILGEEEFANEILSKEDNKGDAFHYDVSIKEVIELVSRELGVPQAVILSPRRSRPGSFARGIAAYLAKTITGTSMKQIGKYFSKGEAALAHRYRIIEERIQNDDRLKKTLQHMRNELCANRERRIK